MMRTMALDTSEHLDWVLAFSMKPNRWPNRRGPRLASYLPKSLDLCVKSLGRPLRNAMPSRWPNNKGPRLASYLTMRVGLRARSVG